MSVFTFLSRSLPPLINIPGVTSTLCISQKTHEECITNFIACLNLSYKSLPVLMYQITSKFRDEPHPKHGLVRGPSADPGNVGGLISEEFHVQADVGEDRILVCSKCSLKFNSELKGIYHSEGNYLQVKLPAHCVLYNLAQKYSMKFKVAHCFLLGERYSKCFDATYQSPSGSKLMFMGCYGLGISRLLAVCIEHLTRVAFPDKSKDQITQLRWPVRIAPYSGSIVLQKETAKDSVNPDELKYILDTIQSDSINFKLLGDILVDDRKELSLGRKILDQSRLGIPWILIVKVLINS
uniref:Putative proline--tRNA ligase, mitochondrial n=1 Tax=Schistosoma haematobium TaxID=6185 RepID=A0A095A5Y1_SCHHA